MTKSLLEVDKVSKSYGGIVAVDGVSFTVAEGSITALIGPNGAGKTTAFDMISGVVNTESGSIRFDGNEIANKRPHAIARAGVGRTFQITRELRDMTVIENLAVPGIPNSLRSLIGRRISEAEHDLAMETLVFLGIEGLAQEASQNLSYGQRKLLEIASVLMTEPRLMLLDEPAGGVNPVLLDRILERIEAINERGISFLIVEHNMDVVMRLSDSIVVMAHGQVILQDTPAAVRDDDRVLDAYLGRV